jgi:hypothetical protein
MVCSIFIASSTSSGAPFSTPTPACATSVVTLPDIGRAQAALDVYASATNIQRVDQRHRPGAAREEDVATLALDDHHRMEAAVPELGLEHAIGVERPLRTPSL